MIILLFSTFASMIISYAQAEAIPKDTAFLTHYKYVELSSSHGTYHTAAITDIRSNHEPTKISDVKFTLIDIKNGTININPNINSKIKELSPYVGDKEAKLSPTKPKKQVYIISIRDESETGYHDLVGHISDFYKNPTSCPPEAAILIHGWDIDLESSRKDFDRASMSIDFNKYEDPIIGIVWKSDHTNPPNIKDWASARMIASNAGHGLAKFLRDFKDHCNDSTLRIVAHSLGTRVVVSALEDLDSDDIWKSSGYEIRSVHFLGAAIPNDILDTNTKFADFIRNYVADFYNLYSPPDKILNDLYPFADFGKSALGLTGSKAEIRPTNYVDVNVASEIMANDDANGDGKCDLGKLCPLIAGQNHLAYWGSVDEGKHWIDDGVMNVVVDEWKEFIPIKIPDDIIPHDIIPKVPIP